MANPSLMVFFCLFRVFHAGIHSTSRSQFASFIDEDFPKKVSIELSLAMCRNKDRPDLSCCRKLKWAVLRHAILGKEPFRFSAMIGEKHRSSLTYRLDQR